MNDDTPLASLSLTHISYTPGDNVSYLCAFLALVPPALCVAYLTLIWSTREVEIVLMGLGQAACEGANWALKRWIKEDRPKRMNGKGYGMPSSHAQFVFFFTTYLALFLLSRHTASGPTPSPLYERLGLSVLGFCCAGAVAWSRIYLNYHTPKQVLVGVYAGVLFAFVWYTFTAVLRRREWISWGLETRIARAFRFRDLVVREDLADAGWVRWEELKRKKAV